MALYCHVFVAQFQCLIIILPAMNFSLSTRIDAIVASEWNRLAGTANPFISHQFLSALERNDCVGTATGWFPQHLAVHDDQGRLVGAMPMYIKNNSYGEFVFDWAWANAYERNRLTYFPKVVTGVPFTPATGPRLLYDTHDKALAVDLPNKMVRYAIAFAQDRGMSSVHWLFPALDQLEIFQSEGLLKRLGCQYHWHNSGYDSFDEFLQTFTAEKRKKVKQDRRRVRDAGIEIVVMEGKEIDEFHWRVFYDFYCNTFDRKGGIATLTLEFFEELSITMPQSLVMILVRHGNDYVAGALNFKGEDTLYGRHWGCNELYKGLHFEACYYQGIEYCIKHGLKRFEPGAQGEYKISRGFKPVRTWSAHWIAHPEFRRAIADFIEAEDRFMEQQIKDLTLHIPFKKDLQAPDP